MIRMTFIILLLILDNLIYGQQLQVRYRNANGQIIQMPTNSLTSDFGRRHSVWTGSRWSPSPWHMGTDYQPQNCDGLSLVSIGSGRVQNIENIPNSNETTYYKILTIDGGTWNGSAFNDNGNDFGYGHIFNDVEAGIGTLSGNFVFLKMNSPNQDDYAILNLNSVPAIAIGKIDGGTVTYEDTSYTVTNKIIEDQLIAPIGGSGGYAPHLHLYMPKSPSQNVQGVNNAKNPLELVAYTPATYNITIDNLYRLTNASNPNVLYGCSGLDTTNNAAIRVKVAMQEQGTTTFFNSTYDVEEVRLLIKGCYESENAYRLIQGTSLESRIKMGGLKNSQRYPNQGEADIAWSPDYYAQINGTNNRTGLEPHAYHNGNYDLFYFSDIFTRIQNDNRLVLAPINNLARYPDGKYDLLARMTTIRNVTYPNNNNPQRQIIIDNFCPYIEKVKITQTWQVGGFPQTTTIYNSEWQWFQGPPGGLIQEILESRAAKPDVPTTIEITSDEPLEYCNLTINPLGIQQSSTTPDNDERTLWKFEFDDLGLPQFGLHTLKIEAQDLADHQLQTNPSVISIRQQNMNEVGDWYPEPCPGADENHSFEISSCMLAFSVSSELIPAGEETTILITNLSSGYDETNYEWRWSFGNANTLPVEHNGMNPPPITFLSTNVPGDYTIQLQLIDGENLIDFLQHNIEVYDPETYLDADFEAESENDDSELYGNSPFTVDFTDISTGNPDSWQWDFGDGWGTSTLQNPSYTFYNLSNSPQQLAITLQACNTLQNCAVETKESLITVYPENAQLDPVANFSFNQTSLFTPCTVSFTNSSSGIIDTYDWDLNGDGIFEYNGQTPEPIEFINGASITFSLKVKNTSTQVSDVFSKQFYVYENPNSGYTVDFSWNPEPAQQGNLTSFEENVSGFYYSYNCEWHFIGQNGYYNNSFLSNPTLIFNDAGVYSVILEVYDFYGSFLGVCSKQVNVAPPSLLAAPEEIVPNDISYWASFGQSVSIDGNFAVVGASGHESGGNLRGAIYIFEYDRENQHWMKIAGPLVPDDVQDVDMFGSSVSISGNYIVASAPHQSNSVERNGAVYVYEYDGNSWNLDPQKLIPSDATFNDYCGWSLALDGVYLVIGTSGGVEFPGADSLYFPTSKDHQGKAYIFKQMNGNWVEVCKIFDENGYVKDGFGRSVSISGTRVAVGSSHDKAFVFNRVSDNVWTQQTILLGNESDLSFDDIVVSVSQNSLIVGDFTEYYGPSVTYGGRAYIFELINDEWTKTADLPHLAADNSYFGYSVSINGKYAVAGAPGESDINNEQSGAAYFYRKSEYGYWNLVEKATPDFDLNIGYQNTNYGKSVSVDANSIIVGRPGCSLPGMDCSPPPPENFPGAITIFSNYIYPCDRMIIETDYHPTLGVFPENAAGFVSLGGDAFGEVFFQTGVDIAYAGDEIVLLDGFTAANGCHFEAKGMLCSYQSTQLQGNNETYSNYSLDDGFKEESLLETVEFNKHNVEEVRIYPNPATGKVSVEFHGFNKNDPEIIVSDIFGKRISVDTEVQDNTSSLDFSPFPKGIYVIIIKTSDRVFYEKIVLQ